MRVVLGTNILVSALLSPFGPPARVLDLALTGEISPTYDDRILAEYREVLARPKFKFATGDVADTLIYLESEGLPVIARPLPVILSDADDLPFLEGAAEADAVLITGNIEHYPKSMRGPILVLSPAEFLQMWHRSPRGVP
jgi:putative PIN family toxin of toxin-antitoxin system